MLTLSHYYTTATPRSGAQQMLDRILGRYSLANLLSTHPPLKSNLVFFFLVWLPKKKKRVLGRYSLANLLSTHVAFEGRPTSKASKLSAYE